MSTYDVWLPRYALRNRLMFFCRLFSPAVGRGSCALSTFLDRRTQRVKGELQHENKLISYERVFKILENDMFIAEIGQAILKLLSFTIGPGYH